MKNNLRKLIGLSLLSVFAALPTALFAQGLTTSSLSGIVKNETGGSVSGANVTIVHVPSGTTATTVTGDTGRFDMSGLRVGGPYSVTVKSGALTFPEQSDIYLALDQPTSLVFSAEGNVLKLDTLKVVGSRDATFADEHTSNSTSYSAREIADLPSIRRDVQDIANTDSRMGLVPNTSTGEFQLSAPGQNYRYNSFLVDGMQTNDSFGLNGNGFSSLRSPVPIDAIESLSIDLSPYDVRRAGFTGALMNSVIKSGTNEYKGSVYMTYTDENLRGENPLTHQKDTFNDVVYGLTLGGPIVKNKLFFFVAYENFDRTFRSQTSQFNPTASQLDQIIAQAKNFGYDPGALASDVNSKQQAYLAKLDWNINSAHRLSFTYRRTDGSAPIFADNISSASLSATTASVAYTASLSNHWYQQPRKTDSYTAQWFANWTPDFRTEVTAGYTKYDGSPKNLGDPFPEVLITGVTGSDLSTGAAVTSGSVRLGTERSRQLNAILTDTKNAAFSGEWSKANHTVIFGGDFQEDHTDNQFAQYVLGQFTTTLTEWLKPTPSGNLRQAYLYPGYDLEDAFAIWNYRNYGAFIGDTWHVNSNLTLTGGLRLDYPEALDKPAQNPTFGQAGFTLPDGTPVTRNDTTNTGNYTIGPRVSFNYKFNTERQTQLRGGVGVFQGRNPMVWLSNAYSNNGAIASNTVNGVPFNPDVSIQTAARPQAINITDPDFKQPVVLKWNLAIDHELPWWNMVVSAGTDQSLAMQSPYVLNLNLGAPNAGLSSALPDGRIRYGANRTAAKAAFSDVFYLTDSGKGYSESYSIGIRRPMRNHWSWGVSYTHSHSTDVNPMTSSVAFSNWSGRGVYNPNENAASISNYNTPNKIVASLSREFSFFSDKRATTSITAVYRGQTGHNYSWGYFNDINGDGVAGNDLLYMPTHGDPTVKFATPDQETAFWAFADANGLSKYAGKVVPRNAGISPWQDTLDLHISQRIPVSKRVGLEIFADMTNFANLLNKKWGIYEGVDFPYGRSVVNATVAADGSSYTYTYGNTTPKVIFSELSRWQLQFGARVTF